MKKISLFLLTLPLCTIGNLTFINTVKAQEVTSDGTVSTTVTSPDRKNFNINDGTTRGTNLFHSFKEFSVPTGGSAVFNNAANIQNIISRVTGGSKSTIDGLIKANGGANLFLLNPAGILFGPNASLNIGGSFLGSTANSFIFSNGFEFSATNPQAPPLLTINLPIGLRYGENPQSITVQGPGHNITSTSTYATIRTDNPGLSVQPEQTLALVGGDVLLEGGNLRAESGRIELGSVRSPSLVNLSATNSGFALDYSAVQNFGDISLSKKASLDTSGQRGGEVQVQGKKLSLRDGSTILSITEGSRTGGNFIINASESVELIGESADGEFNSSFSTEVQGSGSGGDININTRKFTAADGGQLAASTFGKGNAGNVRINAADTVSFAGTSNDGFPSAAFSTVEAGGEGKGGEINITAGSLELINGGQLNTFVRGASETTPAGKGNAGNVKLDIGNGITIAGVSNNGTYSGIFSAVYTGAEGKGGNIELQARSVEITDGAYIDASTYGKGDTGSVKINATDTISFSGVDNNGTGSAIFSAVYTGAEGKGGNIELQARSVSLTDGAQLSASTYGKGDAGSVRINATDTVSFSGTDNKGNPSAAFSTVEAGGVGNGDDIYITAGSLELTNGGELNTFVRGTSGITPAGKGNAGDVKLDIRNGITIAGVSNNGTYSGIFSGTYTGVEGKGGNIELHANSVEITDGAYIDANTYGKGDAGSVRINATDTISFTGVDNNGTGSAIFSTVYNTGAEGKGGNIELQARSVSLTDGAQLSASTYGKGDAGSVRINATDTISFSGIDKNGYSSRIRSTVYTGAEGKGGNIELQARSVSLTDGAYIDASTYGKGDAGSVRINASDTVSFSGVNSIYGNPSAAFSTVQPGGMGNGGDIYITAGSLELTNGGKLNTFVLGTSQTASTGKRNAGNVKLDIRNGITIAGVSNNGTYSGITSAVDTDVEGNGGNIELQASSVEITDGAYINASTYGKGDAGNVRINATDTISFTGSGIFSIVYTGAEGKGGNIELQARSVSLTDGAYISASTDGKGDAGNVRINASGPVSVNGGYITSSVESSGVGSAGGIDITARSLSLTNAGRISTSNFGGGAAGNIKVTTAKDIRLDNQAIIRANTNGGQGNITLNSRDLILRSNSRITTNATGTADGGRITIDTGNLVALEKSEITAKAQQGYGGEVIITTRGGRFLSPDSIISASSEAGPKFSGTVQFNTPDTDPSQGLIEFPETVTDATQQIAQNPCLRGGGEFIITGRGGLPADPSKIFSSDNVRVDLVKPVDSKVNLVSTTHNQPSTNPTDKPIVPAQGWIFNEKGEVVLVAYDPTKTGPQRSQQTPSSSCAAVK